MLRLFRLGFCTLMLGLLGCAPVSINVTIGQPTSTPLLTQTPTITSTPVSGGMATATAIAAWTPFPTYTPFPTKPAATQTPRPTQTSAIVFTALVPIPMDPNADRPPAGCGDLPPGMAGLIYGNRFTAETTLALTDHQYKIPPTSWMLIYVQGGKKFTIDVFVVGVGRYPNPLGPFTWDAGYCTFLAPHN